MALIKSANEFQASGSTCMHPMLETIHSDYLVGQKTPQENTTDTTDSGGEDYQDDGSQPPHVNPIVGNKRKTRSDTGKPNPKGP